MAVYPNVHTIPILIYLPSCRHQRTDRQQPHRHGFSQLANDSPVNAKKNVE